MKKGLSGPSGLRYRFAMLVRLTKALAVLAALAATLLLWSTPAHAGSWKLRSNDVQEVSGAWHLYVSIELSQAPAIAHVPMKFHFTKQVVYERALVDNSKDPVVNKVPLVNQMPQVESLDVDFADGTGKIFKGTRFDFGLTRTRGFEAGEYKMQLRTADGVDVGTSQNLILRGDNPVVDRRSLTFNAKEPHIKKVDTGIDGGAQTAKNDVEANVQTNEVTPVGSASPFIAKDAFQKTPEEEIKEKPGGCGCVVTGFDPIEGVSLVPPALGLLFLLRRRRAA